MILWNYKCISIFISNPIFVIDFILLKLETLLLQAKLSACEDSRTSLEMILANQRELYDFYRDSLGYVLENETALSFTKVSIDKDNKIVESSLKKGSYIVIASFKASFRAKIQIKKCLAENQSLRLFVAQNRSKTWFHVCIDDPFTKEDSAEKVFNIRQKGFKSAWAIILN